MKASAKLVGYRTSPFKMRLLVDMIRGKMVAEALVLLAHNPRPSAVPLRKLLLSAMSNWRQKNVGSSEENLKIQRIFVDEGVALKRMLPAPQGRAYRVKKRSLHIFVEVDAVAAVKESEVSEAKLTESLTTSV